ncbi:DUF6301 family protein [Nocardia brasiliensis]|uniref:DUF6301 family protein n=1 Tax=Nocardia brasiliensis TaxID=37326 RepID=UPI0018934A8E|nr:DUF6301 family protein [Nocardia brasiliensis]MBF6547664.1 hypothetical protein [Nocardia brasiliensis]
MTEHYHVDGEAIVDVIRAASQFDWTWQASDIERFSALAGWAPESREDSARVWAATDPRAVDNDASFELVGNDIRRVVFSITGIVEKPEPTFLARTFAETSQRVTELLGKQIADESGPTMMSWWRTPKFIVEVAALDHSVTMSLIPPSHQMVYEVDARRTMTEYSSQLWSMFTDAMAVVLSTLPSEAKLIIESFGNKYVQFAVSDTKVLAEVVSNAFLDEKISDESEQILADAGWHPPVEHAGQPGNWTRSIPRHSQIGEYVALTQAATVAFREVLQVRTTWDLTARGWVDGPGNLDLTPLQSVVGTIRGGY